jgi:hypothetical protein
MRFWPAIIIFSAFLLLVSCAREAKPLTPLDTFKTYTQAIKKKDITTMKLLLSEASRKMHEAEARAKGVTLDDVMRTEKLFTENQTSVEFKNEKIEGDKATLDVKNSEGKWQTVPFVREEGVWKIDNQGYANQIVDDIEEQQRKAFDLMNSNRQQ